MPRYVAFLRGINVGKRRPAMSQLREFFEACGFDAVETFIASGNVVFSSKSGATGKLEAQIARRLEASLGYRVDTFVRTLAEVAALGKEKLFADDDEEGVTIHVGFLQEPLAPEVARKLAAIRTADDEFRVRGRDYYWLCRVRASDSKVWGLPEMRALRLPTSSMRNLTTIRKLVAKHPA